LALQDWTAGSLGDGGGNKESVWNGMGDIVPSGRKMNSW